MKLYDKNSTVSRVPSGVPQGRHLSPIFSLFVNGIKSSIPDSKFPMLADDLKFFRRIDSFATSNC